MMNFQFVLVIFIFFVSCAGYRFQDKSNPFAQYSISSLSIPMFYNQSSLGNVSGRFTKEIFNTLTPFNDLILHTGDKNSDAVLIGIIESDEKRRDLLTTQTSTSAQSGFGRDVIGDKRDDFLIPSSNAIKMYLRIIVIKHPTPEEIKFLQTEYGDKVLSSKIVFNERISLSTAYGLKQYQGEAISVLGTQNEGLYLQAIDILANQAAESFRDMILYAF